MKAKLVHEVLNEGWTEPSHWNKIENEIVREDRKKLFFALVELEKQGVQDLTKEDILDLLDELDISVSWYDIDELLLSFKQWEI